MTKQELRNRYKDLNGYKADARWGVAKLTEEVEKAQARENERRERLDAEAAQKAENEARWAANKARRGPMAEFAAKAYTSELTGADRKFARLVRATMDAESVALAALGEFSENFAKNPAYAMKWSTDLFALAAKVEVAREVARHFEHGSNFGEVMDAFRREVMRRATSSERSSSAESNLMDRALLEAYAKVVEERMF